MKTEALGNSKFLNLIFKPAGMLMGSRLREWLMNPVQTLGGAGIQPGQIVLEVGCGTGYPRSPADWRKWLPGGAGSFVRIYRTGFKENSFIF